MNNIPMNVIDEQNNDGVFNIFDSNGKVYSIREAKYRHNLQDNMNLPLQFLTAVNPQTVNQLIAPTTAELLVGMKQKKLDWADTQLQVFYNEMAGNVEIYGDLKAPVTTEMNLDWYYVGHYRLQTGIVYGALEAAQYSKANINIMNEKLTKAMLNLKLEMNSLYWYGYQVGDQASDRDLQGILNAKNLNNTVTLNEKLGGQGFDIEKAIGFFGKVYEQLITQTKGLVTQETPVNIGLPPSVYSLLISKFNKYGNANFFETLASSFPNAKLVLCPELEKAIDNKDAIVAIAPQIPTSTVPTAELGYSEDYLFSLTTQNLDATFNKVSCGCCGFICYQPSGVARFKDVLAA